MDHVYGLILKVQKWNLKVSYHKALKKLLGVPYWYSNHDVCNHLNRMTFGNMVNLNIFRFLFQIQNSISPCLKYVKKYLLYDSFFTKEVDRIAYENYKFNDILT